MSSTGLAFFTCKKWEWLMELRKGMQDLNLEVQHCVLSFQRKDIGEVHIISTSKNHYTCDLQIILPIYFVVSIN